MRGEVRSVRTEQLWKGRAFTRGKIEKGTHTYVRCMNGGCHHRPPSRGRRRLRARSRSKRLMCARARRGWALLLPPALHSRTHRRRSRHTPRRKTQEERRGSRSVRIIHSVIGADWPGLPGATQLPPPWRQTHAAAAQRPAGRHSGCTYRAACRHLGCERVCPKLASVAQCAVCHVAVGHCSAELSKPWRSTPPPSPRLPQVSCQQRSGDVTMWFRCQGGDDHNSTAQHGW